MRKAEERYTERIDKLPKWDALSLDTKLQQLAWQIDSCIVDAADVRRAIDAVLKLDELSEYVFNWMKNHGEVL